jgi:DnaJ-class molecular chaperone
MDTKRLPTRWLYVMDYMDEDTGTVAATIGSADDRNECEGVVGHETLFYQRQGFTVLRREASELCRSCEGDGLVSVNGAARECPNCGGFTGPFRRLRFKV